MFKRAERKRAKLRMALCGVAGAGKTRSAIEIALGLANGGKIAMIDTENGSGALYSHIGEYDIDQLRPPFSPDRYIAMILAAERAGYSVLIIDSLSHAWAGEGGVLDIHDRATQASKAKNSYMAWRDVTPKHNQLINTILTADLHIIATMRSKSAYEMVDDGNGKQKPVKVGLAPIQREGIDYEFTVVLDISVDGHVATSSKDRTGLFDGQFIVPTPETGKQLYQWLESGADVKPEPVSLAELKSRADAVDNTADLSALWQTTAKERGQLSKEEAAQLQAHFSERKAALTPQSLEDRL